MRLKVLAVGAIVGAAAAGSASAQTMPVVQQQRQFDLGVRAEAAYDSNVARGSKALAAQRGVVQEDYTFRPSAIVDVTQPFGSQILFLRGGAGYDFYDKNNQLEKGRADITGGYASRVGPCQPMLVGSYKAAQSDLNDADTKVVSNLLSSVVTTAGLQCGRSVGPGLVAIVQREDLKNSADQRASSDSTTGRASVTLSYSNPSLGTAGVVWNYADTEFPNRINFGPPLVISDGYFTAGFGLSYQRNLGARISLDALLSRTMVKREMSPPGTPLKFKSTTYGANASYRMSERIEFQAHALREVRPSNRPGKLYDIAQSGEVLATYRLGSRYDVKVGYRRDNVDSNTDTAPLTRPVVTDSRTNAGYASVHYRQTDRINWLLDIRYEDRKTNLPDFNYTSTRIGIAANAGF